MDKPAPNPPRSVWSGFGYAWSGLRHSIAQGRHMRFHVLAALLVCSLASAVPFGVAEKATLIFCIVLVLFAEVLNTAVEHLVDLVTREKRSDARLAKDSAAGAVLVTAAGTLALFATVVVGNFALIEEQSSRILRGVVLAAPILACAGFLMRPISLTKSTRLCATAVAFAAWGATFHLVKSYEFWGLTAALLSLVIGSADAQGGSSTQASLAVPKSKFPQASSCEARQ